MMGNVVGVGGWVIDLVLGIVIVVGVLGINLMLV